MQWSPHVSLGVGWFFDVLPLLWLFLAVAMMVVSVCFIVAVGCCCLLWCCVCNVSVLLLLLSGAMPSQEAARALQQGCGTALYVHWEAGPLAPV